MRDINTIVLHCSDTPDTMDVGVPEINEWHKQRGWDGIGYHWVIKRDGSRHAGRPESKAGAHVEGHNATSIGVCWVGRSKPSEEQMKTIVTFLSELLNKYKLDTSQLFGHYEFNKGKSCPNLNMDKIRELVRKK